MTPIHFDGTEYRRPIARVRRRVGPEQKANLCKQLSQDRLGNPKGLL
jgi:hypothetical protein